MMMMMVFKYGDTLSKTAPTIYYPVESDSYTTYNFFRKKK